MRTKTQKTCNSTKVDQVRSQRSSTSQHSHPILQLQQKIGNQAVQRLLQAKDIQAKLTIGAPNDKYEKEADNVADHIVRKSPEDERSSKSPEQALNLPTISRLIQRTAPKEDAADQVAEIRAEQVVKDAGSGQPMPEGIQRSMENSFGRDFSHVRMHTDHSAQKAAADLNARAFTHKNHIWLGRGENVNDKRIMAHELTHVIQQGAATTQLPGVQKIQRQAAETDPKSDQNEMQDRNQGEDAGLEIEIKPVQTSPISKTRSKLGASNEHIEMPEGQLQRKNDGVPDIQRVDPATVGAAVAVIAVTYTVVKDIVNLLNTTEAYSFDRMRGQKYPGNNKNWEQITPWHPNTWDLTITRKNKLGNKRGMKVRIHWESNGYGISGVYFTKLWDDNTYLWDFEFIWLIQPLMAVQTDIYGHPVAQVKIALTANYTSSIYTNITNNHAFIIDGEGGGREL